MVSRSLKADILQEFIANQNLVQCTENELFTILSTNLIFLK